MGEGRGCLWRGGQRCVRVQAGGQVGCAKHTRGQGGGGWKRARRFAMWRRRVPRGDMGAGRAAVAAAAAVAAVGVARLTDASQKG